MPVQPIPDDDPQVSPYLCVSTHVEDVSPQELAAPGHGRGAVTGLHRERRGTGPRLLFLNGSGATLETSALLIDAFARSLRRARLRPARHRAVPRRHADRRRTPWPTSPPTPSGSSTTPAGPRASVFGVSFGGMVAQELAVTWPERIERLVLFCTSPGGAGGSSLPAPRARLARRRRAGGPIGLLAPRPALHPRVAGRAPARPGHRRHVRRPAAGAPQRRPAPTASGPSSRPAATTTCGTGSAPSPAPRSSAAGRFDGIAPVGQQRGHRRPASPAPSSTSTRAATCSSCRTRPPCRTVIAFLGR